MKRVIKVFTNEDNKFRGERPGEPIEQSIQWFQHEHPDCRILSAQSCCSSSYFITTTVVFELDEKNED